MKHRGQVACINWSHPTAPHALAYFRDGFGRAYGAKYFATWADAMAYVTRAAP